MLQGPSSRGAPITTALPHLIAPSLVAEARGGHSCALPCLWRGLWIARPPAMASISANFPKVGRAGQLAGQPLGSERPTLPHPHARSGLPDRVSLSLQGLRVLLVDWPESVAHVRTQLESPDLCYTGERAPRAARFSQLDWVRVGAGRPGLLRGPLHDPLPPALAVTSCSSSADALSHCRSGVSSFDVVLAEVSTARVGRGRARAPGAGMRGPVPAHVYGGGGPGAGVAHVPAEVLVVLRPGPVARAAPPSPTRRVPRGPRPRRRRAVRSRPPAAPPRRRGWLPRTRRRGAASSRHLRTCR